MKTILLIEDNLEVRENTAEILELANYKVLSAENGKIGIELARKHIPDLIICDIMMPELDGYGVINVLGKSPETASIPFIFLTAKTEKSDLRKGMNMGADDYLTKPFDDVELLNTVELRLKKNEQIKTASLSTLASIEAISKQARGFEELEKIISDQRRISKYKKKQQLYSEGNIVNNIFFVVSGKIKTYKTNEDGRDYITGLHKENDFLGYINLLEDSCFTDSATAIEDSEICLIPKQEFFALLFSNRDIAEKFVKMLSNDVIENEERLIRLAYNSVRKRVAESLLLLHKNYHKSGSKDPFSMSVSREDLASITGASKETVIRTLSEFKDEKLIDIQGSTITLINENKLRNMRN